jgi:lysozyme family protein
MITSADIDFSFNKEIAPLVIRYEGTSYTDNKRDYGGATKFGWTLRTYKVLINSKATKDTIRNLSKKDAMHYYRVYFWDEYGANNIESYELSIVLFLAQINLGPYRPNNILKKVVNNKCKLSMDYDGIISGDDARLINSCSNIIKKYQSRLYKFYSTNESIKESWIWAKNGLTNRIFLR